MTRRILIAGMNQFGSGKTTVARNLALDWKSLGYSVEYFKPLSGHNYWQKYDHTKTCFELGQIVSYDAWLIKNSLQSDKPITVMNPIHNLFVPARIEQPTQVIPNTLSIQGWDSVLVMKRITQVNNGAVRNRLLVAEELVRSGQVIISADEMTRLVSDQEYISIKSIEEAQAFQDAVYEGVLSEAFYEIGKDRDIVIIESFNNSVWPWEGLTHVDVVIVVGPGQMFFYNPAKMQKAVEYARRYHEPIRSVTIADVYDLLRPIQRVGLHPEKRVDASNLEKIVFNESNFERMAY